MPQPLPTQADVGRLEDGAISQIGEQVPSEVLLLVREVNRLLALLALLAGRLRRSREALGNLAHALKAPLTVLTQLADDDHVRRHPLLGAQIDEQLQILRGRIAQRGVRLDEATEGHGLGLAVASGIAASCGAELHLGRSQELGSFAVSLSFPAG